MKNKKRYYGEAARAVKWGNGFDEEISFSMKVGDIVHLEKQRSTGSLDIFRIIYDGERQCTAFSDDFEWIVLDIKIKLKML